MHFARIYLDGQSIDVNHSMTSDRPKMPRNGNEYYKNRVFFIIINFMESNLLELKKQKTLEVWFMIVEVRLFFSTVHILKHPRANISIETGFDLDMIWWGCILGNN